MLRDLLVASASSAAGVELTTRLGPFRASVVVARGEVVACTAGPFAGGDALFRLLLLPAAALGPVAQGPCTVRPPATPVGEITAVLAEVDAVRDEVTARAVGVGSLERVWAVRFAALKTILEDLPEDVKRLIRLCDGTRDVRRLVAEGPLAPLVTLAALHKLLRQGVLIRADVNDVVAPAVDEVDDGPVDRRWLRPLSPPPTPAAEAPPSATPSVAAELPPPHVPPPRLPDVVDETTPSPSIPNERPPPAPPPVSSPRAELEDVPVVLSPRRGASSSPTKTTSGPVEVSGYSALPASPPKPRAELTAWLGEEEAFFATPATRPASPWLLAGLVVVGAFVGGLVAHACRA